MDIKITLLNINPAVLKDLHNGTYAYIGRGSFGVVKLKLYRGIYVAVKEVLPRTLLFDVIKEAEMVSHFTHPSLPHLFGICVDKTPYSIITQFEGICIGKVIPQSLTLHKELQEGNRLHGLKWICTCAQLVEAVRYLYF